MPKLVQGFLLALASVASTAEAPALAPASRVGDQQSCPLFCGPLPHYGGPILPPGAQTVLICGQPAARVTDSAFCSCASPQLSSGSTTVLINGLPAVRVGDATTHGGEVTTGCATVLIGG